MKLLYASSIPIDAPLNKGGPNRWMFRESLKKYGIQGENFTLGCTFNHNGDDTWWRLLKALEAHPSNEVVLVSDAWDVFFTTGLEAIERTFLSFDAPIVFAMETNLFPPEIPRFGPLPEAPTRWRYINGGQIIGRAGALLNLFNTPDFWPRELCWCNQEAYNRWWILHPDSKDFALDFHCKLFCNLYDNHKMDRPVLDAIEVRELYGVKHLYNNETETYPCSFHGNGGWGPTAAKLWRMISG
ncbi:hypothetical protein M0R72_17725 [Candidatus Pacearchaeota archaeon]|jgi:hypothetical protein|nr:hypothetical protein [Candidatus Pacearchaeota archaeon]